MYSGGRSKTGCQTGYEREKEVVRNDRLGLRNWKGAVVIN